MRDESIEGVLRRERAITLAGLASLVALAWLYLAHLSREMADMAAMGMAQMGPWTIADAALAVGMWAVMMVAMMLPSAAPMVLVFTAVNRKRRGAGGSRHLETGMFVLGYLAMWGVLSLVAAGAQGAFHRAALLSDDLLASTPLVGSIILIGAGIYQLTPLKYACLSRCRTPLGFLLSEWREGRAGVFVMGLRHGLYCVGCCWILMALLFVGGVMNLVWIAAIAGFVLLEKVVPAGRVVAWGAGAALVGWGGFMLLRTMS